MYGQHHLGNARPEEYHHPLDALHEAPACTWRVQRLQHRCQQGGGGHTLLLLHLHAAAQQGNTS
jgi:hypothetical protein